MSVEIPHYPKPPEPVTDAVVRSIAKPDAFAKPGVVGNPGRGVRIRLTTNKSAKPRKRKKDYRDVNFY